MLYLNAKGAKASQRAQRKAKMGRNLFPLRTLHIPWRLPKAGQVLRLPTGLLLFWGIMTIGLSIHSAPTPPSPQERCTQILQRLWAQQGGETMPSIEVSTIEEYGKPALYDSEHQRIVIDPEAYELCLRLTQQKDDALAFLIAHELIHSYQHAVFEYHSPGFFVKTKTLRDWAQGKKTQRRSMERQADVWGAVLCYLAGYEVATHIPSFIESLYETYHLDAEDPLYDSKRERLEIAKRAQEEVERALLVYDMANYFSVLQQHDKDTVLYQYLIRNFKSPGFYNNLGLSYLLLAVEKLPEPFRSYPYPFSLDTETRLEEIFKSRPLSPEQLTLKSIDQFSQILSIQPHYLPMRLNRACAYHIMSGIQPQQAAHFLALAQQDLRFIQRMNHDQFDGSSPTLTRAKHDAQLISALLQLSEHWQQGARRRALIPAKPPTQLVKVVDQISLERANPIRYDWEIPVDFSQGIHIHSRQLPHSTLLTYQHGNTVFHFQRITQDLPNNASAKHLPLHTHIPEATRNRLRRSLPTFQGTYFLIDDDRGLMYQMDANDIARACIWYRSVE